MTGAHWRYSAVGVLAAGVLASAVEAQTPVSTTRQRASVKRLPTSNNVCMELESSPSALVNAPEGLALLRLKRELESAALTLEQQRQLEGAQVQRISQVQRGMDSLMQIVVRFTQDEQGGNVFVRRSDGRGGARPFDSVRVTMRPLDDSRGLFIAIDSTMRTGAPSISRFIRSLQPQVAAFAFEAESALPNGVTAPSGYMGLSLSGAQIRIVTPDGVMTSHCEYPLVETVDLGSPAARAGLTAGDTLVAYNGRDVMQSAVNYAELITAGNTVRIRVRRAGKPREVPVTVGARKEERAMVFVRAPQAPLPPSSPTPPPMNMFSGSGVVVIAGAQFATIDDEFAESLGLEPGVLVLRVPAGTPAADAGLRSGEVVRSVNGTPVRDVTSLRRTFYSAREARLLVQNKSGASRTVVLELR
ncbi:PDZ domain-containing protein [Gemmatimonas phototrophica]|uniref:PDZ domain-containing protein n=1 Tax=Gemmatimonas phototrophica TaxID=1379270 RepID=UPI001314DE9D|nr:PDZ domain-containing protein [Gemmatimonas phototrophica]